MRDRRTFKLHPASRVSDTRCAAKMITEETGPYKLRIVPRIANAILVRSIVQFLNNAPTLTIISVCRPWPFMLLSLFRSA